MLRFGLAVENAQS